MVVVVTVMWWLWLCGSSAYVVVMCEGLAGGCEGSLVVFYIIIIF